MLLLCRRSDLDALRATKTPNLPTAAHHGLDGHEGPQTAKVVKSKPLSERHDSGTQKVRYASEVDTVIAPSLGLCSPPTTRPGQHANLHDKLLRPRGAKPRMFVEQRELARDMPMRLQFRYLTYAWPAARCPVELSGLGTPALRLLPEMR